MGDGWEKQFRCSRRVRAVLDGYRRAFNKASVRNWGTKARPCPTLNVVKSESSSCPGIAFEFPSDAGAQVRAYLVEREGKGFELHELSVRIDSGATVNALVPLYAGPNLLPEGDLQAIARMILGASGTHGSGVDYVDRAANELLKAGIDDPVVNELKLLIGRLTS
ncbi:gamma-glutamylcyclotransferase [Bradyrhizobium sp. ORS 86]|uniref:gamma-glutamylcyclotransferase n=1 Tax=Bradyrhizobium sp. ORS 86 TaxID=1685970 RepID=UPI00388D490C